MLRFCITAVLLLLLFCSKVFAQLPAPPDIKSPNVSALATFGAIPVGYNTGTPNISIPIHTIESGKIKVPITLKYHASSVRPNEHPGWAGLGWSLEAAGTITRTTRGRIDEITGANDGAYQNYYDHGRFSFSA